MSYFNETIANIEEYLTLRSNHNTASMMLPGSSSSGFLCEILTEGRRYFMKLRVDDKIDYVILEMYLGITVQPPYIPITAQYCMEKTDEKKVGSYRIAYNHGDVYFHIEASMKDAPVSGETIEYMEHIAIASLRACENDLELISHGLMPASVKEEKPNKPVDFKELLHAAMAARGQLGSDSGTASFFPDFLRKMAGSIPDMDEGMDEDTGEETGEDMVVDGIDE